MINGLFKWKKKIKSWNPKNKTSRKGGGDFLPFSLQKKRTNKTTAMMNMMIPMTMEIATAGENPPSSILVLLPTSTK